MYLGVAVNQQLIKHCSFKNMDLFDNDMNYMFGPEYIINNKPCVTGIKTFDL